MVPSKSHPIRFTPQQYRLIKRLKDKLGMDSTAAVVKHALARLAELEGVTVK